MIFNAYAQPDEQAPFQVLSCGHIFAKHGREINRPIGRSDWLLFYVVKEEELFYFPEECLCKAGTFVLFAPGELQHHIYLGKGTAEFYYIHFQCDVLPDNITLTTSHAYPFPLSRRVCDRFEEILEDITLKPPFYQRLSRYRLLSLLTLLEREVQVLDDPKRVSFKRIERAIQHMNRHYNSSLMLDDYAAMCGMSKFHFLRVFEEIVGKTPLEYRNHIRLEHAAELLLEEDLSVEEIGMCVGYITASYFSSAFKKKYHCSPKQYQILNKRNA